MTSSLLTSLSAAWTEFLGRLREIVPDLLVLGAILLAGIVAGVATRWIVGRALRVLRFDALADRTGSGDPAPRRTRRTSRSKRFPLRRLGRLPALRPGRRGLAPDPGNPESRGSGVEFLPALVAAGFILVAGLMLAQFLSRATLVAAVNAEVASRTASRRGVRGLLVVLTVAMTLEQLGVARGIVTAAFSILFGGVVLALAVAFGLGGRHLARRLPREPVPPPPPEEGRRRRDHL